MGTKSETLQSEALDRARNGESVSNYPTIYSGFMEKGIPEAEIRPRENVLTYHAWRAVNRQVKRGEHGVRVVTYVPIPPKKDEETGEIEHLGGNKRKTAVVFHISQTEPIGGAVVTT